jgi:branched-chain amino acid transport system permease protein
MDYFLHILILSGIFGILALSLNLIAGYTGIMSVAHGAFMGIGAYTVAILTRFHSWDFFLALLVAILLTMVIAAIISFPLLRLKGDSLMLVSFGFALIVYNVLLNWVSVTNGALGVKGVPSPVFFGWELSRQTLGQTLGFLLLVLVFLIFTWGVSRLITNSPYGTVLKAIRENEMVAKSAGHHTKQYKRTIFILGCGFAAMAGGLFGSFQEYINPDLFDLMPSMIILLMTILGGFGTLSGPVLGAFILITLPELLRYTPLPQEILPESQQILYGLILFGLMCFRPQGLLGKYIL